MSSVPTSSSSSPRRSGPTLRRSIELCDEALAEAAGDDVRSARILGYRSWFRLFEANVRAALADARAALEKAERVGDPALLAVAIARVGQAETWAGEITPGLLERGVEIEERARARRSSTARARALARPAPDAPGRDRPGPRASSRSWRRRRRREATNAPGRRSSGSLSLLEWFAGRWPLALDHAAAAHELASRPSTQYAALDRDGSRRWSRPTSASSSRRALRPRRVWRLRRRCRTRSSRSSPSACSAASSSRSATSRRPAATCASFPARLLAGGWNDPTAPVWADAIETLIAVGELEQARAYLEQYEVHAERLGSPLGHGRRCALPRPARRRRGRPRRRPSRPSSAPSPSWKSSRTRSSAAARCSASASCAGRRSRRRPRARRSSRRSRSSRSSARDSGRRRPGRSSGGSAAAGRPPTS